MIMFDSLHNKYSESILSKVFTLSSAIATCYNFPNQSISSISLSSSETTDQHNRHRLRKLKTAIAAIKNPSFSIEI